MERLYSSSSSLLGKSSQSSQSFKKNSSSFDLSSLWSFTLYNTGTIARHDRMNQLNRVTCGWNNNRMAACRGGKSEEESIGPLVLHSRFKGQRLKWIPDLNLNWTELNWTAVHHSLLHDRYNEMSCLKYKYSRGINGQTIFCCLWIPLRPLTLWKMPRHDLSGKEEDMGIMAEEMC